MSTIQMVIGAMPMPADFRYRDVFTRGMPKHEGLDSFSIKHPPMPASRWAKIFSPFDALKGFDDCIHAQEKNHERQKELDEDEQQTLNNTLSVLHNFTFNSRMARKNRVSVSVKFYDDESQCYIDAVGTVMAVDEVRHVLKLDTGEISFEDLAEVRITGGDDNVLQILHGDVAGVASDY